MAFMLSHHIDDLAGKTTHSDTLFCNEDKEMKGQYLDPGMIKIRSQAFESQRVGNNMELAWEARYDSIF
jgi:hypothetical protein